MTCRACGHANPADARFCGGCGARLERVCAVCRAPNPGDSRFCHGCGGPLDAAVESAPSPRSYTPKHLADKILTAGSALQGERKQVTVLFVDVSGFTSLSERLDPEDVHRLMSRAFDLMLAEVHRYEGTVNQFLGDGIMALFGAPIAHEDHARRAVHAALGIRRALEAYQHELAPRGITFRARQGLNTGLVVVGSIGGDLRMDYTAVGDTTNVAARLQQAGEPGRVTIAEATHRLVQGYFDTRALGRLHVKGKAEPIEAWEVVGARESRTRLEVGAEHGLTPFVGRSRELGALLDLFGQARDGHGQVALVVGEAGIGKSRLLLELRRRVGDEAEWHEGHCLSFGQAMTLHPLVDLVRRQFRVDDADDDAAIAAKLQGGVTELDADLAGTVPYLRALLSVDPGDADVRGMSPVQRRGETFEALRRLLVRAAARRPQVVVIEDLHWCDSATEQFLAALVDSVPALRALVVLTYRPGHASPIGERTYVTRVVPAALSAEDSASMAAAVLAAGALPEGLRALVVGKAEGNPFYVEELVKSLEEGAVSELAVPSTVHDVIAARIDRLAEAPKRTLQLAAVIGREFTRRLVDRLGEIRERTDDQLRELTALELIHERRLFPELAYMFKHALTQDVAYASLLVQRRKELHGLIGRAIEELYRDRLTEHYEMLAHHFSKAEDWERALDFLLKAADKATKAFGLRQAIDLYDQALAAAARLGDRVKPATLMAIHRQRGEVCFGVFDLDGSREAAESLVALARRHGDRAAEAGGLAQLASTLQWAEEFPPALERVREAIEISEAIGASRPLAAAFYVRGYIRAVSGELEAADEDIGRSLSIARATGDAGQESLTLYLHALYHGWQGRYDDALAAGRRGVALAREHRLFTPLLRCLWNEALALSELGHYDAAFETLREGLAMSEKVGDDAFVPRMLNTLGWLCIQCGDFTRGIDFSERAYAATQASARAGHGSGAERRAFIRINEGDAFLARGDLAAAAEALAEADAIVQHPPASRWMTWRYGMHCYLSRGELALARGDAAAARRLADEGLALATLHRSRKYEAWSWRLKGESARRRHAWGEAEEALARAVRLADAAVISQAWRSHAALGALHAGQGRRDAAAACDTAARAVLDGLRAGTKEAGLRAGLASAGLLRALAEPPR
ncbi:MAG TPA: adenylate/guanylate cyclase domain-containing protein [Candidatus Binatia bacterium]|nr:adenylate/guanylate cyclase domain-containing protein [Candidatus Binatia bacterium]